ncbi:polymorphic toxin-type HINT domain-containing protein [Streptomyces sp. NPDC057307]|uniref:polymorphic toxin-type HINT domain-containing protein n=1 Tax=Streptomyces sp. NPDC057307 TaxID=3346096 RepID=UPI003634C349
MIASVVTEVVVGGACFGAAAGAGLATGGVGFGAAAGCGAVAGAAGNAIGNAFDDKADHSVSGQLSAQAEGATTDTKTGKTTKKKVVATITTEDDRDFTEITISVDDDYSRIVATDTHPFWVPELKKWVKAGDLHPGQWLRTSAGTHVQIAEVTHYTKRQRTHDLTIQDIHAYYVLAEATPVLVHNCNLSQRASAIHAAEPDEFIKNKVSTVAVVRVDTPRGRPDLIAGSGDGLTPAQMSVPLRRREMHVPNVPGMHAEQNALLYAKVFGYAPVAGGTSRNVCLRICAPIIRGSGGRMVGNVFPGSGKTTTRQRGFVWQWMRLWPNP